ncbi:MAG: DUF3313 domain-containing protein [Gammaproteobacteria bacterium]|nr:DUF3313 domain-containing protein [Gammaproteobacteria bacterium]
MNRYFWMRVFYIALTILLAACAPKKPLVESGFLTHYDQLTQSMGDPLLREYEKKGVDWTRYRKLQIEPTTFKVREEEQKQYKIDEKELSLLSQYFYEQVVQALGGDYPIVKEPGKDVLRVRLAITDAVPVSPALNILTVSTLLMPLDIGGASIEAEFLDSLTGERLYAIIQRKEGSAIHITEGYSRWSHVKSAMQAWAKELRMAFDAVFLPSG